MTEREARNLLYPVRPDSAVTPLGRVEGESSIVPTGRTALIGVVAGIDTTTRPEPAASVLGGSATEPGASTLPVPRVVHSIGWRS